ncbi:MAG: hypothetical protein C4334_04330 [Pyrinomonas sp.]|mgnify:CR=1 FL=1|uniref:heavy-metal-associated domain-containing protein n=1 Tax=Pyrinomonas sp. TaxID=2080306 RepID=UPI003333E143
MQAKLIVEGMHCVSCAADIRETLEETQGVRRAEVDFQSKTATVEYDEKKVPASALIEKIEELGYKAEIVG